MSESRIRELEAIVAEFVERIRTNCDETKSVAEGVYGKRPQGEGMDYWRGRRDLAYELAAFMHPSTYHLGRHYLHISELCGVCRMVAEQKDTQKPFWPDGLSVWKSSS